MNKVVVGVFSMDTISVQWLYISKIGKDYLNNFPRKGDGGVNTLRKIWPNLLILIAKIFSAKFYSNLFIGDGCLGVIWGPLNPLFSLSNFSQKGVLEWFCWNMIPDTVDTTFSTTYDMCLTLFGQPITRLRHHNDIVKVIAFEDHVLQGAQASNSTSSCKLSKTPIVSLGQVDGERKTISVTLGGCLGVSSFKKTKSFLVPTGVWYAPISSDFCFCCFVFLQPQQSGFGRDQSPVSPMKKGLLLRII